METRQWEATEVKAGAQLIAGEFADATAEALVDRVREAADEAGRAEAMAKARAVADGAASALIEVDRRIAVIDRDRATVAQVVDESAHIGRGWKELEPRDDALRAETERADGRFEAAADAHRRATAELTAVRDRRGDELGLAQLGGCDAGASGQRSLAELAERIAAADAEAGALERDLAATAAAVAEAEARDRAARQAEEALREATRQAAERLRGARARADAERGLALSRETDARCRAELEAGNAALAAAEADAACASELLRHLAERHQAVGCANGRGRPDPARWRGSGDGAAAFRRRRCGRGPQGQGGQDGGRPAPRRGADPAWGGARCGGRRPRRRRRGRSGSSGACRRSGPCGGRAGRPRLRRAAPTGGSGAARCRRGPAHGAEGARRDRGQAGRCARRCRPAPRERQRKDAELHGHEERLMGAFPGGIPAEAAAIVAGWKTGLAQAREAEESARAALAHAGHDRDRVSDAQRQLERELASLRERCTAQRTLLATLPDPPGSGRSDGESPAFAQEAAALADQARAGRAALDDRRAAADAQRSRSTGELERAAAEVGLAASGGPDEVRRAVERAAVNAQLAADRANDRQAALEERLARRRDLEDAVAASRARASLYRALADELRGNRFIDYVLGESVRQLAAIASQQLRTISGGRYSLAASKTGFDVVDHDNADERRASPRCRAARPSWHRSRWRRALARQHHRYRRRGDRGRAGSEVHHELFGTLDAETLDTVIEALEALRDSGRLVGVITHVAQLAERIPDGLEVRREGTSSRVERRR